MRFPIRVLLPDADDPVYPWLTLTRTQCRHLYQQLSNILRHDNKHAKTERFNPVKIGIRERRQRDFDRLYEEECQQERHQRKIRGLTRTLGKRRIAAILANIERDSLDDLTADELTCLYDRREQIRLMTPGHLRRTAATLIV